MKRAKQQLKIFDKDWTRNSVLKRVRLLKLQNSAKNHHLFMMILMSLIFKDVKLMQLPPRKIQLSIQEGILKLLEMKAIG